MSKIVRPVFGAVALLAVCVGGTGVGATTEPPPDTAAEGPAACAGGMIEGSSPDEPVARCSPEHPAPRPLAERQHLVVSTGFTAEFIAPLLLAQHYGEFERENLEVEVVSLPFPDALPQMTGGQVDIAVGATDAALMNSASEGHGIMWGMGNFFPLNAGDVSVPQTGLWARRDYFSDPENPDLSELSGATIASAIGIGNSTSYFVEAALAPHDVSITDLNWVTVQSADMVTALGNGAVDVAWLLDPYWLETAAEPDDYVLIGTQTFGESIGGYYFGPDSFGENREASEAFTRAIIRTINTYLTGDYHADADVMGVLSETIGQPIEAMAQVPSLLFDWEVHQGVGDGIQAVLDTAGVLGFTEPLPEENFVDRSLYEAVIAAAANDGGIEPHHRGANS